MANKMSTISKILNYLEDPQYPSLGPHLRCVGLNGIWHHRIRTPLSKFKLYYCYITLTFFFSQYIKGLYSLNLDALNLILQYVPFHMGFVKISYFHKDYKSWEKLIEYTSVMEKSQLAQNDEDVTRIIKNYIRRNRKVLYFFWALVFFTNISIFSEPYQKNVVLENGTSVYLILFDGYTPFGREPPGYYASMFIQTVMGYSMSIYVSGWDMLVIALMIMFTGQLNIVRHNCAHIIKENTNNHQNIAEIHQFFLTLAK